MQKYNNFDVKWIVSKNYDSVYELIKNNYIQYK